MAPLYLWTLSYGRSAKKPSEDGSHTAHSKRAMAGDIVALIDALFGRNIKVLVAGHDRGARVTYRLALDYGERLKGACVVNIVPITEVWSSQS